MSDPIYLDHAAATPVDEEVLAAMLPYYSEKFHNPSAVYLASQDRQNELSAAREKVAHWLGAKPSEIIFTSGATEANNIAIYGVLAKGGSALVSAIEHESVLEPVAGFDHRVIAVDERAVVSAEQVAAMIDESVSLVSVIYANNEVGTVQKLSDIAREIAAERERRRVNNNDSPIYLHTDASQAANLLDLHVDKLGVDLMTLNAAKTYGPKMSGALYVRAGIELAPYMLGGGQEKGLRSGTENVAQATGLAHAVERAQKLRHDEARRLDELRDYFVQELAHKAPDAQILGHRKHRLSNLISVMIPGVDGERLVMMLDEKNIQVATGSACSALSDESSHVIRAMGFSEAEASATLRISMGRSTTKEQLNSVLEILPAIIAETKRLS